MRTVVRNWLIRRLGGFTMADQEALRTNLMVTKRDFAYHLKLCDADTARMVKRLRDLDLAVRKCALEIALRDIQQKGFHD